MNRLLIVGGTGFIGRNLTIHAVKAGLTTVVLSLNRPSEEKMVTDVQYLQADSTNLAQLRECLSNTDFQYMVNLSGYIDHSHFLEGGQEVIDAHFGGVRNLLQSLDWRSLKRFVQIGSSDEYGSQPAPQHEMLRESTISPYSLGKVAATQLLQMLYRTEEFPAVMLRLFLVYGPGQDHNRFFPQIIQGCLSREKFPTSAGEQLRDFCYVDDISEGIVKALTAEDVCGEVINLASGKPVAIREVVEQVQRIIGRGEPEFEAFPYRTGENMALYADISKAKQLLNWEPSVSLEVGIGKTVDDFRERML